jgi:hypothetical protein
MSDTITVEVYTQGGWGATLLVPVAKSAQEAARPFLGRNASHVPDDQYDIIMEDGWEVLRDLYFPICEHGMSGNLCSGPNHFGEPGDEWAN